jgi:phosphatidylglycerol---prolipoprotein diacylglyceryl transferase
VAGAALGSKILFWLEDPQLTLQNLHNPTFLIGGKTIVGALIGGLVTVELVKRYIKLRTSTGDLYAIPLALGVAVGRIGCFLTGLSDNTYGTPTNLPWGVNFGDGIPRHPTQLYEIAFILALIPFLYLVLKRTAMLSEAVTQPSEAAAQSKDSVARDTVASCLGNSRLRTRDSPLRTRAGDTFKLFMVAYASLRLLDDFIKPYPRLFLGLGAIQWACVGILLYYASDIARWITLTQSPRLAQT